MQCNDCPNQTDGKCCHQLIRPQGSKTMNVLDEAAWEREFKRVEATQKQRKSKREGWELKESEFNLIAVIPFGDMYEVKDNDNEINNH